MVAPSSASAPALSYADRAKKNIRQKPANGDASPPQLPPSPPRKQAPVNVWTRRKEEFEARHKPAPAPPPQQPSASTSSLSQILPQNGAVDPPSDSITSNINPSNNDSNDDDDPFVVRTSRVPRPHVPFPPADNTEDWPQVGQPIPASTSTETAKAEDSRNESRKGGAPKWIPLQIQAPADAHPRDSHPSIANRQSANSSRHSSNYGHGRNSRNHSGRNSANQSASHSRIHSNAGSAHSSPRHPRSKRLPAEDLNGATNRSSRGPSPLPQNMPSFLPPDIAAQGSNYGAFLSPPHGPASYHPQQPSNLPPVTSPIYQSPSNAQQPLGLPDPSLPMPPVHRYSYVPYFPGPYDYVQPSAPYPYWNGHHSHPGSGQQSPAYPPSATPSNYAALPMHVQQHFYPPPPMQPSVLQSSSTSERSSAGRLSPVTGLDVTTSVPALLDTGSKINGELKRSTSVVFGTIDDAVQPSPTAVEVEPNDNGLEKGFKFLAIGVGASGPSIKPRKSNRPMKGDGGEKEDHSHHHPTKIVNGDITFDPPLAKQAESAEAKWEFGTAGLASPAGGAAIDIETKPAIEDSQVNTCLTGKNEDEKGKTTAKEGEGEERAEMSRSQPFREGGGGRGRRGGYIDRGYPRRGGRGANGFNRGYRGYSRGGGGPHSYGSNSYQQRQGPPPSSYNVPSSLPFQGVPSPHTMGGPEGNYYNAPPTPLTTYIPTGYDPYAPSPQQPPTPVQSFSSPSSATSPPMPVPLTPITFPLEPTRYYLLGQLEYYLSPQNMAQDLFLRKHMDSRGWISISLLASFNRVQRLTQDHQIVHEALMYSGMIEVKDDFARMGGWEQFVLPDAVRSMVESDENPLTASTAAAVYGPQFSYPHPQYGYDASGGIPRGEEQQEHRQEQQRWNNSHRNNNVGGGGGGGGDGEGEEEGEEDEDEDDVVIVMGEHDVEGKGMWPRT